MNTPPQKFFDDLGNFFKVMSVKAIFDTIMAVVIVICVLIYFYRFEKNFYERRAKFNLELATKKAEIKDEFRKGREFRDRVQKILKTRKAPGKNFSIS